MTVCHSSVLQCHSSKQFLLVSRPSAFRGFSWFHPQNQSTREKKLPQHESETAAVRVSEGTSETKRRRRTRTDRHVGMRTRSFLTRALALALVLSVAAAASRAVASEGADGVLLVFALSVVMILYGWVDGKLVRTDCGRWPMICICVVCVMQSRSACRTFRSQVRMAFVRLARWIIVQTCGGEWLINCAVDVFVMKNSCEQMGRVSDRRSRSRRKTSRARSC